MSLPPAIVPPEQGCSAEVVAPNCPLGGHRFESGQLCSFPDRPVGAVVSEVDPATWVTVRRYAVPGWMIERCAEAREAGDWRASCAAGNVDVLFDLPEVGRRYGSPVADQLMADLRGFAPDLVRWHMPRLMNGWSTLLPGRVFVLASYGRSPGRGPFLVVCPAGPEGPQRLTLAVVGELPDPDTSTVRRQWWTASRHLWDARHADELRVRCGGGDRTPFFARAGRLRDAAELPTGPSADDRAAHTEWVTTQWSAARDAAAVVEVFAAAGVALDFTFRPPRGRYWGDYDTGRLARSMSLRPVDVSRVAAEAVMLRAVARRWQVPFGAGTYVRLDVKRPGGGARPPVRHTPSAVSAIRVGRSAPGVLLAPPARPGPAPPRPDHARRPASAGV